MTDSSSTDSSALTREAILAALRGLFDVPDIVFLLRNLGIKSAAEALAIVARYYPANRISIKTQYLLEGLFDEGRI